MRCTFVFNASHWQRFATFFAHLTFCKMISVSYHASPWGTKPSFICYRFHEPIMSLVHTALAMPSHSNVLMAQCGEMFCDLSNRDLDDLYIRLLGQWNHNVPSRIHDTVVMPNRLVQHTPKELESTPQSAPKASICRLCHEGTTGRSVTRIMPCLHTFCMTCLLAWERTQRAAQKPVRGCPFCIDLGPLPYPASTLTPVVSKSTPESTREVSDGKKPKTRPRPLKRGRQGSAKSPTSKRRRTHRPKSGKIDAMLEEPILMESLEYEAPVMPVSCNDSYSTVDSPEAILGTGVMPEFADGYIAPDNRTDYIQDWSLLGDNNYAF
jgi:hypothetical protein